MRLRSPQFAFSTLWLAIIVLLGGAYGAQAQTDVAAGYPNKPIKLVVGFAAGGGNDIFARIIADKLQTSLGQPVVVENKPGAAGRLAAEYVAGSPPDGYTLLIGASGAMAIAPAVYDKMGYQTLKDFAPVSMFAAFPLILVVHPSHPAKNVQELVAWLKANPDKANYASSSVAFTLATELFKLKTGAPATAIPYKSSGESIISVIGQQSTFTIIDPPPTTPQVKGGQVRALAVTRLKRSPELPDVPTLAEAGVAGVDVGLWSGVFAPAATPKAIVKKLEGEIRTLIQAADVQEKFKQMATPTVVSTSEEFSRVIDDEIKMWRNVAKQSNVKIE
jgi:tripartite-type tricarboxylate transporter receptor subunit TctC